jgi:hypothetical protein
MQTCMLMVLLDDLPVGRANTYLRPGSHRQISEWLAETNTPPFKVATGGRVIFLPPPCIPFVILRARRTEQFAGEV